MCGFAYHFIKTRLEPHRTKRRNIETVVRENRNIRIVRKSGTPAVETYVIMRTAQHFAPRLPLIISASPPCLLFGKG